MDLEDNTVIILRELGKLHTRLDSIETKVDDISLVHERIKKEGAFNRKFGHLRESESEEETSQDEDQEEEEYQAILDRKKRLCECCCNVQ